MDGKFWCAWFFIYPAIVIEIILPILVIVGYKRAASILAIFCLLTAFLSL